MKLNQRAISPNMSPPQSKFNLILDTGVIGEAFRLKVWSTMVNKFKIFIADSVVGESKNFKDENGKWVQVNLAPDINRNRVTVFQVTANETAHFLAEFGPNYADRMHAGELESLVYLFAHDENDFNISSGDAIIYRTLGRRNRTHAGISLQELLDKMGRTKSDLEWKYTKKFRDKYAKEGTDDFIISENL